MPRINPAVIIPVLVSLAATGCAPGGQQASAPPPAPPLLSGAAAGSVSVNANPDARRCSAPLGSIAIDDGINSPWGPQFAKATGVPTIEPLLRQMVQQSNCFVITSLGNKQLSDKVTAIMQQQRGDEYRIGSNLDKGQRVAADYFLQPQVLFVNSSATPAAGGTAAAQRPGFPAGGGGTMAQSWGSATVRPAAGTTILGQLAQIKLPFLSGSGSTTAPTPSTATADTSATLTLVDLRSAVQVSEAIGNGHDTTNVFTNVADMFNGGGGSSGAGAVDAYQQTPAGRATVAAVYDAFEQMVIAVKNYKPQNVKGGLGTGGQLKVQGQ